MEVVYLVGEFDVPDQVGHSVLEDFQFFNHRWCTFRVEAIGLFLFCVLFSGQVVVKSISYCELACRFFQPMSSNRFFGSVRFLAAVCFISKRLLVVGESGLEVCGPNLLHSVCGNLQLAIAMSQMCLNFIEREMPYPGFNKS